MRKLRLALVGAALCGLLGCGNESTDGEPAGADPRAAKVTQAQFGDAWPFTVSEGTVRCVDSSSVVFDTGGRTYALNGTAKSQTEFPDFDPIWADDSKALGTKKDIKPMIDRGSSLCPR